MGRSVSVPNDAEHVVYIDFTSWVEAAHRELKGQTKMTPPGPIMTRKDFELIADTLESVKPLNTDDDTYPSELAQWELTVSAFTGALALTNERFDRDRFKRAAGVDV